MDANEVYFGMPLRRDMAEKLKRIAKANGRPAGREGQRIIERSVSRVKEEDDGQSRRVRTGGAR